MHTPRTVGIGSVVVLVVAVAAAVGGSALVTTGQADGGTTTVDSCTTISEPGRYVLEENLTASDEGACIHISASDVVFDGAGHTIEGDRTESDIEAAANGSLPPRTSVGVSVNASDPLSNVTVENVTVRGWYYGIVYEDVSTVLVREGLATDNGVGVYVLNSRDVELEEVTPTNNVVSGILVEQTSVTVSNTSTPSSG